jgi:DNA-binding GntR family transcriptional regulator
MSLQLFSHAEQVATHLRAELLRGRWITALPGTQKLGKELGVNHNTVEAALRLLEEEGLLVAQGHGRRRKIVLPKGAVKARSLRVKILLYDGDDAGLPHSVELLARLQEAGFAADYATKSLHDRPGGC